MVLTSSRRECEANKQNPKGERMVPAKSRFQAAIAEAAVFAVHRLENKAPTKVCSLGAVNGCLGCDLLPNRQSCLSLPHESSAPLCPRFSGTRKSVRCSFPQRTGRTRGLSA